MCVRGDMYRYGCGMCTVLVKRCMCTGMCIDVCIDMHDDVCMGIYRPVYAHVYKLVYGHVCSLLPKKYIES